MLAFAIASATAWALAVLLFRLFAERKIAAIVGVIVGAETLMAIAAWRVLGPAQPVAWVLQGLLLIWLLRASSGRMPPAWWSALVGIPANAWAAGVFLALPWSITGIEVGAWFPFLLAGIGVLYSLSSRKETVRVDLGVPLPPDGPFPALVQRAPGLRSAGEGLRIVHLSDPHLGAFMSVARLRRICARAVAAKPDLVLITGDFFTFESWRSPDALAAALAPLRAHPHVYACRGNHDLESPDSVAAGLEAAGVKLLVDEAVTVPTRVGPVQIVGFDFRWREREKHLRSVLVDLVRPPLRIAMLHDPSAFSALPANAAELVLSGHTHGGHVGLVGERFSWTVVRNLFRIPDHGPWARAGNRMYVSRAIGHYGFQVRLGVPAEESVLEVIPA